MDKLLNKPKSAEKPKTYRDDPHPFKSRRTCTKLPKFDVNSFRVQLPTVPEYGDIELPRCESDAILHVDTAPGESTQVNVTYKDAEKHEVLDVGAASSPINMVLETPMSELNEFLSRPIEIYSTEISVGVDYAGIELFPWNIYLTDSSVVEKLNHYKLLRACLKITILVTGTKFHYGRFYAAVRPCRLDNNTTTRSWAYSTTVTNYIDSAAAGTYTGQPLHTLYTSRQGVFIDPGTNQPSEICWPFFFNKEALDLNDTSEFFQMGALEIFQLNPLECNTAGDSSVTIKVLACLEDVQLSGLTAAAQAGYISDLPRAEAGIKTGKSNMKDMTKNNKNSSKPKSSKKKSSGSSSQPSVGGSKTTGGDEYSSDGPVSAVASAVAGVADYAADSFARIPYIGTLARATSIVATGVGGIARLFGWSNPRNIEPQSFVTQLPVGNTATAVGSDSVVVLAYDPKQEITIDPSSVGLDGTDEMSFMYVAGRAAHIATFDWNCNGDYSEGIIASWAVAPGVCPQYLEGGVTVTCPTPIYFVSRPFQYWTGSLKYRIQVVASQMARGRLRFQYDPNLSGYTNTNVALNQRYTHFMDLEADRDFSFEVNWCQPTQFLPIVTSNVGFQKNTISSGLASDSNGIIIVSVMNELTTPDNAGVQVNVYISAGDSFNVRAPVSLQNIAYARADLGVGPPAHPESAGPFYEDLPRCESDDITYQENAPAQEQEFILNGDHVVTDPNMDLVYFGEDIQSIRYCLKRYNLYRYLKLTYVESEGQNIMHTFRLSNFPVGPAVSYSSSWASGLTLGFDVTPFDYNFVCMTHLRYYCQGYVGYRGSIRYKVIPDFNNYAYSGRCHAMRDPNTGAETSTLALMNTSSLTLSEVAKNYSQNPNNSDSNAGAQISNFRNGGNLQFELPFFTNLKFFYNTREPDDEQQFYDQFHKVVYATIQGDTNSTAGLSLMTSIGEDFSFMGFIGAPPTMDSDQASVTANS
nr:hypothetical protein 2 [Mute swan feces associated picorna-like virus 18]